MFYTKKNTKPLLKQTTFCWFLQTFISYLLSNSHIFDESICKVTRWIRKIDYIALHLVSSGNKLSNRFPGITGWSIPINLSIDCRSFTERGTSEVYNTEVWKVKVKIQYCGNINSSRNFFHGKFVIRKHYLPQVDSFLAWFPHFTPEGSRTSGSVYAWKQNAGTLFAKSILRYKCGRN